MWKLCLIITVEKSVNLIVVKCVDDNGTVIVIRSCTGARFSEMPVCTCDAKESR